ncbi:cytochrome P450 [Stackebrandtia endophytica]|uniref:Cytochrome P450 n=1 Tax=Stackebrandtia endophytica TaxID=1496996 RepID=A0A543B2D4_9ACTN|nr:cytochrome P450 [Stackebrandtia endophytica]TQL78984.1 cytochrome P450 [Stackebrandtia endophytica]
MSDAPHLSTLNPFKARTSRLDQPDPTHAAMREAGPVVRLDGPGGSPVWIVTAEQPAREILTDPRFTKNPSHAPANWNHEAAPLEQTAEAQPSLTTLDGEPHAALRRAHAPLFSAKRIRAQSERVHHLARTLLAEVDDGAPVDLMAGFTTRFPLTVLIDLLGLPMDLVPAAGAACLRMLSDIPGQQADAIGTLAGLAASGLDRGGDGIAARLRDRLGPDTPPRDLHYHLFSLIFAGQLTTDAALGFVIAEWLTSSEPSTRSIPELVDHVLRQHPPAPFTLWRFTTTPVSVAGIDLPAGAAVLIDIRGIGTDPGHTGGTDLVFGAGPHYCIGAQLARLELTAVLTVLRDDFPRARLAVPAAHLQCSTVGGIMGDRLVQMPVLLRP